ncbi:MAG TPA: hypothetical protein PLL77_02055 [Pyrinomonadaceae bacterium]|nr:hypothetical protein [Pyrinomonadaceae bacterium]
MKKKKLEVKLTKTKKKLAKTKSQLDEMLSIMEASGMPKSGSKSVVGEKPAAKPAPKVTKRQTPPTKTTRTPTKKIA